MSIDQNTKLETLSVEILHRIFDRLDAQTIFFSLRNTCQQLRAVVNSYDRCVLDFESIAKYDFDLLCRLIDPRNVISLTLSDDDTTLDQVEVFVSLFNFHQFNRLRSLILVRIEERHLETILKNVNSACLISFSFSIGKYADQHSNITIEIVSSLIAQANLLKLELLNFRWHGIEEIVWPDQSNIQQLRLDTNTTFNDIFRIVGCLSHLHTLSIACLFEPKSDDTTLQQCFLPFRQLTSLAVESVMIDIDNLEMFLSLIPSLIHLRLISHMTFPDGNRWEQFIQTNLPLLINFEFVFTKWQDHQLTVSDIESIVASYRTSFWLEHKKWFITCEYSTDERHAITLYSIPICVSYQFYQLKSNKVFLSTLHNLVDNNAFIMDNITRVQLTVSKLMSVATEQQVQTNNETTNHRLFRKVKTLEIELKQNLSSDWILFISTLIDLTTIIQIKLTGRSLYKERRNMRVDIANFLQRAPCLTSLDIGYDTAIYNSWTADNICSIVPSQVKHLSISIKNVDQIKLVLQRLQHLSSAKFRFGHTSFWKKITEWIEGNRKGSKCNANAYSMIVWLGKNAI